MEKIPPETCWAITSKLLLRFMVLLGEKAIASELGKGEGIFAPVLGAEKWAEINTKTFIEGGKVLLPQIKEMFDIPVEDAIGAVKLAIVVGTFVMGPELTAELVEATPERAIVRWTKCTAWDCYDEFEVLSEHRACLDADPAWNREGLKAINPKITYKLGKARPKGDPYCEWIFEYKEE